MAIRTLDELNNMSTSPEEYFGDMDLTESQIEERLRFTDESYEAILESMYEIDTYKEFGAIDYDAIRQRLDDRMAAIIAGYVVLDDYLRQYSTDFAQNFVDATQRNIDKDWYLSEDRALFNAENSANDTINYKDYKKAVEDGFTHKKWVTEHDNRVRDTHKVLNGKVIPILEYFDVGSVLMRFPKDYELAFDEPQETVNCRCSIKYLNKGRTQENVVAIERKYAKMESNRFLFPYTLDFLSEKSKQYGKKIGKHAEDYGLDPSNEKDRRKMMDIISDIVHNSNEIRIGKWKGQKEEVLFYIKGDDAVVKKQTGEFITILKDGAKLNGRVKNARIF